MIEKEIYLIDLIKKISKHTSLIISLTLIFGALSFAYSSFIDTPTYESNTTMIISNSNNVNNQQEQDSVELNQIQANKALISTYSEIVKSKGIANQVIQNLSLNMDYEEFSRKVSIEPVNDTQIISVKVVDTIPSRAADIANETANIFKNSIGDIMKVDNVQILDGATLANEPSSPNVIKNTVIGSMLGFVLGLALSLLREISDKTIKNVDQVSEYFDIPVIGILPDKK